LNRMSGLLMGCMSRLICMHGFGLRLSD
jgi:hypothetical protein